jgi:O-methyltransferase
MIKKMVKRGLGAFNIEVRYRTVPDAPKEINPIQPWRDDPEFRSLVAPLQGRTLVDDGRLFVLYNAARHVRSLAGNIAEVGVYKGGTAKMFSQIFADTSKQLHLFDTFQGMPETDPVRDWHKKGDFNDTSLESVRSFIGKMPNVQFHPGFFPASAKGLPDEPIALVHIDVDIYRSVYDCCEYFYFRMTKGGVMVFDDYGFTTCPGAKSAVDEFFKEKVEVPIYLPTGQAIVFKQ